MLRRHMEEKTAGSDIWDYRNLRENAGDAGARDLSAWEIITTQSTALNVRDSAGCRPKRVNDCSIFCRDTRRLPPMNRMEICEALCMQINEVHCDAIMADKIMGVRLEPVDRIQRTHLRSIDLSVAIPGLSIPETFS